MVEPSATFGDWLARECGLAEHTADVYMAMVDFGRKRGNVLLAVEKARTRSSLRVATAALRLWSRWTGDVRLANRVERIASRRRIKTGASVRRIVTITDEERRALLAMIHRKLEEPYRSTMTMVVASGLRLATILTLTRTQVEVGCTERVPILGGRDREVVGLWLPPPETREAFCTLPQFGGWTRIQELFGRDYIHAYRQVRVLLHYVCRKAGTRQVRPSELGLPESPIQVADDLDVEARCA
jgi:hypothetical protein